MAGRFFSLASISGGPKLRLGASLGIAQTIAWASSYYIPAVMARPIAEDLGCASSLVYAAFSLALILSAFTAPFAGRRIDRFGGKKVLVASNLGFALGLFLLSQAQGAVSLFLAWGCLGLAMGAGLYDMAFATVVRSYGRAAPAIIAGITLIGGFASTVGWPISHFLLEAVGWRYALLAWAGAHICLAFPLNLSLVLPEPAAGRETAGQHAERTSASEVPEPAAGREAERQKSADGSVQAADTPVKAADMALKVTDGPDYSGSSAEAAASNRIQAENNKIRAMLLLGAVFVFTTFCAGAMASHLPGLLQLFGVSITASIVAGMAFGPAQVAARVLQLSLLRCLQPINTAIMAVLILPLGAVGLALFGPGSALPMGVTHGFGNGIMTIIKGTLPLSIFGEQGYGRRQGLLFLPAGIAQAFSPFLFSLCITELGKGALYVYIAAAWIALVLFLALKRQIRQQPRS